MLTGRARTAARWLAVLLATAVLAAGCGRGGGEGRAAAGQREGVGDIVDQTVTRAVSVEVGGEHDAEVSGERQVRVVVREASGELAAMSVAHVGFPAPLELDDGWLLDVEIGLVGLYSGAGTYELPAGIGPPPLEGPVADAPPGGTEAVSVAAVRLFRLDPEPQEVRFGYLREPCTVELGDGATTGSASCPALVAVSGDQVTLRFEWA